jgi:hypothetical protein
MERSEKRRIFTMLHTRTIASPVEAAPATTPPLRTSRRKRNQQMTDAEQIRHDMDTLLESIRVAWAELASQPFDAARIRHNILWCISELKALDERLGELPAY